MFSENLRTFRKQKGMTQHVLAAKLNISVDTIRRWEQGKRKPNYEDIDHLATALSIPREALIGVVTSDDLGGPVDPEIQPQNDHGILLEKGEGDQKVKIILPPTTETYNIIRELLNQREFTFDPRIKDFFNFWISLNDQSKDDLLAKLHINIDI